MKSYVIAAFILPFVLAAKDALERWLDKRQTAKEREALFTVATVVSPPLLGHDGNRNDSGSGSRSSERPHT